MSVTAKEQLKTYLETPRFEGDDGEAAAEFALAAMNFFSEEIYPRVELDEDVLNMELSLKDCDNVIDAFIESEGDREEIKKLRERIIS